MNWGESLEEREELLEDLVRPVHVLPFDEPPIRPSVPPLERPMSGNPARQRIHHSGLRGNDEGEYAPIPVQKAMNLSNRRRHIPEVLQDMTWDDRVKVPIGTVQPRLAVSRERPDSGESPWALLDHVLANVEGDVRTTLRLAMPLLSKMLPDPAPISSVCTNAAVALRTTHLWPHSSTNANFAGRTWGPCSMESSLIAVCSRVNGGKLIGQPPPVSGREVNLPEDTRAPSSSRRACRRRAG